MATHTLLLYINPVSDWPHLRGQCDQVFDAENITYFCLKGFIKIFVSGSHTSVIPHMLLRLFSL